MLAFVLWGGYYCPVNGRRSFCVVVRGGDGCPRPGLRGDVGLSVLQGF